MARNSDKDHHIRHPGGFTPPSHKGRPRVGVKCQQGADCVHAAICREIYTQDLLYADGRCPEFKAIEKKREKEKT